MSKVINLFAGPGAGKSTTAAGLFYLMKTKLSHKVELVTERAKELVYEGRYEDLADQGALLEEQEARQARLVGKVDYIITDSPLLLGLLYCRGQFATTPFMDRVKQAFNSYDNINFLIERVKPYQPYGRRQSEDSARWLDRQAWSMLAALDIPFKRIPGDESAPHTILKEFQ